ncbi:MAG TPA: glycosyltransferase family 1 protein [Ignavibacteria bacterium]|jgi:glycosyltransferase involved in cell wall biosynthesis
MNITFDYEIFVRQRHGGISRYFYEIITRLLKKDGIKLNVFAGINNSTYEFANYDKLSYLYEKRISNFDKINFLLLPLNKILFNLKLSRFKTDILHKTYFSDSGLDFKCKKIITVHDMIHEMFPQYFSPSDDTSIKKANCINNADGIICVSHSTMNDLLKFYDYPVNKIAVIYHANSLTTKVKSKRVIDEPYILFVGKRSGYKNFDLLLTAYNITDSLKNNFKLVCFGGDNFNFSEKLYLKEHLLTDRIIYLEGNDELLANLYQNASVFVYPTLYEGFGFPPLEAMYYGCPVLASDTSSIPEVVANAALLFEPNNIEDLVLKINTMLADDRLKQDLKLKGFERVKMFSWEKSAERTAEFYKKIFIQHKLIIKK